MKKKLCILLQISVRSPVRAKNPADVLSGAPGLLCCRLMARLRWQTPVSKYKTEKATATGAIAFLGVKG
ncbi:hypothetical protein [Pontibacter kalidii]|uniref:hypothetical protein n=1 Tax=Pontibacter kalidii TaxID=2592049 RepID=UPI0022557E1E|nr:hypothetical protein [Pontibacter kalidii]